MKVVLLNKDITKIMCDAIVNAGDSSMLPGGGVDGVIHSVAGPSLLEECKRVRRVNFPDGFSEGEAVLLPGFNLLSRHVIFTVGPRCNGLLGKEAERLLANCYRNSIILALKHGLKTIVFPAVSTGAFGCPFEDSARVVQKVLTTLSHEPIIVGLTLFGSNAQKAVSVYSKQFSQKVSQEFP